MAFLIMAIRAEEGDVAEDLVRRACRSINGPPIGVGGGR